MRQALGKAIGHAIQGTSDSVPDQDERNTESGSMDTSPPPASEGAADTPLAVPERPPMEDQRASETTSSVPLNKGSTSNNEGDSIAPDRLFEASEKSPRRSEPPKAPDLSEQRKRIEQASTPLTQGTSQSRVERGDLPRLRTCAW